MGRNCRVAVVWVVVVSMLVPLGGMGPAPSSALEVTLFSAGTDNVTGESGPNGTTGLTFELPDNSYVVNSSLLVSTHAEGDPRAPENLTLDVNGDGRPEWAFTGTGTGAFGHQDRDINGNTTVVLKFDRPGNQSFTLRLPAGAAVSNATMKVTGVLDDISFKAVEEPGSRANDFFGYSLAGGADINRDGHSDLVAGAPAASTKGLSGNGYAGVIYGSASGPKMSATDIIQGNEDSSALGFSVALVSDFTRDGFGEVLVGAVNDTYRSAGPGPTPVPNNTGVAYLYAYSSALGGLRNLPSRAIAGCVTQGQMGFAVSELPDLDGDGAPEVAGSELLANHTAGTAAGRVAILKSTDPGSGSPVNIYGEYTYAFYGSFIHRSRDLDGDGRPDIVVGSRLNYNGSAVGAAYVYLSKKGYDFRSPLVLPGTQPMANFSASGASGDFDGDGWNDLAIGAPDQTDAGSRRLGAVFIFWGGPAGLAEERRSIFWGPNHGSQYGTSLACPGDMDFDGADDLLIGAPWGSGAVVGSGSAELRLSGHPPVWLHGESYGECFGASVAAAGDLNGDKLKDFAVGAPFASPGTVYRAGRVVSYMAQVKAPLDPLITVGGSGAPDWQWASYYARQTRTKDFAAKLNGLMSNQLPVVEDEYGNGFNDIEVVVQCSTPGVMILSNISIMYNWTARVDITPDTETPDLTAALNKLLLHEWAEPPMRTVSIDLTSSTPGRVTLRGLSVTIDEPPTFAEQQPQSLPEDGSDAYLLDLYTVFTDDLQPDDLVFNVDYYSNDTVVTVNLTDGRWLAVDAFNGTANDDWSGEVLVTVCAMDFSGLYNVTDILVMVHPVNDPPVITSAPVLNATAGVRYSYNATATDVENQSLSFGLSRGPDRMSINSASGRLEWTPNETDYNRTFEVDLWASDGALCATQSFNLSVGSRLSGVRLTSAPPLTAAAGEQYSYSLAATTDVPNAAVAFALRTGPSGMTILPNGTIQWVPTASAAGKVQAEVEASDGYFTARQEWNITVFPAGTPLSGLFCRISEPQEGNKVSGSVKVLGVSNISVGTVTVVEVRVDEGRWKPAEGTVQWTFSLDTTGLSNGRHTLSARAFDGANYSLIYTVPLEVENPTSQAWYSDPLVLGMLLMIGAVSVGVPILMYSRRRKGEEPPAGAVAPAAPAAPAAIAAPAVKSAAAAAPTTAAEQQATQRPDRGASAKEFAVEDIFLIHIDGRLIHHASRSISVGVDSDILSSMLTAVTSFVKDALARTGEGTLGSLEYGENKIVLERGRWSYLAVVISGQEPPALREEARQVLRNVESEYGTVLSGWDGEAATLAGCKKLLTPLTMFAAAPAQLAAAAASEVDVELMSELEFYQGYVRLKAAVKNNSRAFIMDAALKIMYNEKALRLEKVEPDYPQSGREIMLGNIGIKEKKTVALYLDPQICMETPIEGTLSFKDPQGELHHIDMRRKTASVVCPIMHTDENINVPMMRRMLESELDQKDTKVFNLPSGLDPERAFEMCKRAVQGHDIRLVREFVERAPGFVGEAWYYGRVKGRNDKLVVKTAVRAETKSADFYVASNSRLVVTGLLAELKNDLNNEYKKERPAEKPMEAVTDEVRRARIQKQGSLLDRHAEGELSPAGGAAGGGAAARRP